MTIESGQKVTAPLGIATVVGPTVDGGWMVMYSRKDYTPEAWKLVTPYGGPCIYREYSPDELREVEDAGRTTN